MKTDNLMCGEINFAEKHVIMNWIDVSVATISLRFPRKLGLKNRSLSTWLAVLFQRIMGIMEKIDHHKCPMKHVRLVSLDIWTFPGVGEIHYGSRFLLGYLQQGVVGVGLFVTCVCSLYLFICTHDHNLLESYINAHQPIHNTNE